MQKEIDDARSTADPSLQYECTTLNVNGECLDHLDYTKGTTVIFNLYGVGSLAPSLRVLLLIFLSLSDSDANSVTGYFEYADFKKFHQLGAPVPAILA